MSPEIQTLAESVSAHLLRHGKQVLVLCEAGRTRSVYFCILLVSHYLAISLPAAKDHVVAALKGKHSLKGFMLDNLRT
ncbi:hypothetical protein ACI3PL_28210, partial [Lacticaseibacillus paracasei]